MMTRRTLLALVVGVVVVNTAGLAAERQWQTGTWHDYQVDRPRVSFSARPRDPNSNVPHTQSAREIRTYVIDTDTHRLELRQDATIDTPRIGVLVGQPVQFAIDKKTVYVKDGDREHRLSLRKQTELSKVPDR